MHKAVAATWLALVLTSLALPAWAEEPPAANLPGEVAPATEVPDETPSHARRPIVVGLVAAAFLFVCGLAGANDRPQGDKA